MKVSNIPKLVEVDVAVVVVVVVMTSAVGVEGRLLPQPEFGSVPSLETITN